MSANAERRAPDSVIRIDDGLSIGKLSGIGLHTEALIQEVKREWPAADIDRYTIFSTLFGRLGKLQRAAYLAHLYTIRPLTDWAAETQLTHYANFHAPIWKLRVKHVVTIHDLSPWDAPGLETLPGWYWPVARSLIAAGARRSDAVVVRTEHVKARLPDLLGVEAGRVHVIPDAVRDEFVPLSKAEEAALVARTEERPTILCVSPMTARKNVLTVVRAWCIINRTFGIPMRLVLVGRRGAEWPEIEKEVAGVHLPALIDIRENVDTKSLIRLYQSATLTVVPSRYEGFGIPIIESMACGTPVLASDIPAFREAGGAACVFYGAPGDAPRLASTAVALLFRPEAYRTRVLAGLSHIKQFRWERVAKLYAGLYDTVLGD